MKQYIIPIFICIIILTSFVYKKDHSFEEETPPRMVKISSNFYGDYTEITNFFWLEYYYWTQRVFGDSSKEHLASIPDNNVWLNEYSCLLNFTDYYLAHPSYRDFPVVGISQKQAADFCQWRSDRVFELLLIREGIITHNANQNADNYFSIENYYNGNYNNTPPNLKYDTYPNYKLPTKSEWTELRDYFFQSNIGKIKKCKKKYCNLNLATVNIPDAYNIIPCLNDSLINTPTKPVNCYKNKNVGFYVYGNVSEWLKEDNQYIGGNWRDSSKTNFDTALESKIPTDFIGFRAVFNWKKYKKQ